MPNPRATRDTVVRGMLKSHREILKRARAFVCMCCQKTKATDEAAGAFVYKTDEPKLLRAMQSAGGPRICTYVICNACAESYPEEVVHEKATAYFSKAGLFGETAAEVSDLSSPDLHGLLQGVSLLRNNLDEERRISVRQMAEERELWRRKLELKGAEVIAQVSRLERNNDALLAALGRLTEENQRLRKEIYALKRRRKG